MKKIKKFFATFFFSCFITAGFAMECNLEISSTIPDEKIPSPTDEEIERLQLQYYLQNYLQYYLQIKRSANHNNPAPNQQEEVSPHTPSIEHESNFLDIKIFHTMLPEYTDSSSESENDDSWSTSTQPLQKQKPQFILLTRQKVNGLFQQTNNSKIFTQDAGFANWLDYIPLDFRKLINQEILIAAEKYLLENKSESAANFFQALPYDSIIKTALCFLHYLWLKNVEALRHKTYSYFQMKRPPSSIYKYYHPSPLQKIIEKFTKENYLQEIFHAAEYWCTLSSDNLSFIQLTNTIEDNREKERNDKSDANEKLDITKKYNPIIKIFKCALRNSIEFIEPLFNIQLHSINLSCNGLYSIPLAVYLMENLKELILHKNKIMVILKGIGRLKNLETLDLQNNKLEQLPDELLQLPNLKNLDLRENPGLVYHVNSKEIIKKLEIKGVKVKY